MSIDFLRKINIEEETGEEPMATLTADVFPARDLNLFKYARWLVYALVFLVPLFFLPWTSEVLEFNKQFLLFVISGAAPILYLTQVVRSGRLVVKKGLANYAVLIFLASVLLVSLFSDFRYQSIFGGFGSGFYGSLISSVTFAVLFFLIFNLFGLGRSDSDSTQEDAGRLLNVFGLSLFLALLLGTLGLLGVPVFKLLGVSGQFNTVGTFNSFGILASVLLVFSISKAGFSGESPLRYVKIPALFLSLFLLLLFNWWVLWLAAVSGLVFVVVSRSMKSWRISSYFWPLILVLVAVVSMLLNFNLAGLLKTNLPIEISPSFGTSFGIARQALGEDPLFGAGPENFSLAYNLYKPASLNNTAFWNVRFSEATSELFSTLVSYGLVGFAAFIFLIFTVSRLGFRNSDMFPLFAVFVAAWVLYPYNMTLGFGLWFLSGLLALSASGRDDELHFDLEKSPKHSLLTSVSFVCVLVLVVVGLYFIVLRYAANVKFARALNNQDIDRQTELLVDAVNLFKSEDMYPRVLANFMVSRINQEIGNLNATQAAAERQAIISRIQNFSAVAINLGSETTQRHSEDPANWFSRALVYENLINVVDGSNQWAITAYQEYLKRSPKDPEPHLRIGNIKLAEADFLRQSGQANAQSRIFEILKSAEESFQKALELKPNYVSAIYNLGVVYERQGRVKDAVRQLEIIRAANLNDANLALQLGLLYYRDNQKAKAFSELERAISIFPDFSNARWYLALFYEERGELDAALGQLYRVEKLNPENEVLKQKIGQLEAGKRLLPPQRVTGFEPLEEENQ